MDFYRAIESFDDALKKQGESWYNRVKSLRDKALTPGSVKVSGELPIAPEYEAAINWYNIKKESHLTNDQTSRFTHFIALGWEKTKYWSNGEKEKNVIHWKTLKKLGIEEDFKEALIGRGTKISTDALERKIGDYLITFISEANLSKNKKKNPLTGSFDPPHLDAINKKDAQRIIRDFLNDTSQLVWCSSLKTLENDIRKTSEFNETAQRLGMSHAPTSAHHPYKFYGIKISVKPLVGELKFPTVADARLFHLFEPSLDDIGYTLDLRDGEPSLPEVVIRRDFLKKIYLKNPGIFEVVVCEAAAAKRNQNTWILTDIVGCKLKHQENRLQRVRKEVGAGV